VRSKLIERYSVVSTLPTGDDPGLQADRRALAVMRARLSIIEWLTIVEDDSCLATDGVADAVNAWLADGGDQ
jgi:hypothetical protein